MIAPLVSVKSHINESEQEQPQKTDLTENTPAHSKMLNSQSGTALEIAIDKRAV